MVLILRVCAFVLCVASMAQAAMYTVKKSGGDYNTIQACANATAAGDTCTVFVGAYDEYVTLSTPGTSGNVITFTVNSGDTVTVKGFTLVSYTTISGFTITDSSFSASHCVQIIGGSTHYSIINNTITECGTLQAIREALSNTTSYGTIRGNTISWPAAHPAPPCTESCGQGAQAMLLNGDYHLVENNDISHVVDGIALYGAHNVVRNNTFHDVRVSDFPSTTNDLHVDAVESQCSALTNESTYMLIEGNVVMDWLTPNAHAWLAQDACDGVSTHVIARFNTVSNIGSSYLLANSGSFDAVKDYHNTVVAAQQLNAPTVLSSFSFSNNASVINNLWVDTAPVNSGGWYVGSATGFVAAGNLWYDTTCTTGCTYTNPFNASTGAIKNQHPLTVNLTTDFRILAGSPAYQAGSALTTVAPADTGTGTSMVVTDAAFFQDGKNGVVLPDGVRIGAATTVMIASIDYSTHTITLAESVSRNDGDLVYLWRKSDGIKVLFGTAPDIGAHQAGAAPSAPTGVRKQDED